MDFLWSASTTMRNPERTLSFLQTAAEIEGDIWCDETQNKYQTLLIKNRHYTPMQGGLSDKIYAPIKNLAHEMTYEEAERVFIAKNYVDAPMRGRTSFDPLEKLGLVNLDGDNRVRITNFGQMFLGGQIDLGEMVFTSLLKTQFPNPISDGRPTYNIKPFIGVLHLIKRVNELCESASEKVKGISREEFGIFALSLKDYTAIPETAVKLLEFRRKKQTFKTDSEKKMFVSEFIVDYLSNFQNPEKNCREYTDNMIRYLRLTKYIYIRGGGYYIDLEPRRLVEIEAILANDNASAGTFTADEYKAYIGDYYAYTLPFETPQELRKIAEGVIAEITKMSKELGVVVTQITVPTDVVALKTEIAELREQRTALHNLLIKKEYEETAKIDEAIAAFSNSFAGSGNKPSVELEKWANIALNILNDSKLIKPNSPLGDDNEPTFTAPAGVPDIECYYDDFGAICEVTMLTGRNQWYNEGQPVMRHLRSFEVDNGDCDSYCLFIAPRLHVDTVNTFWTAVKYEYEGQKQRIVPITITSLIAILKVVKEVKTARRAFTKDDLRALYDMCVDVGGVSDSTKWQTHIGQSIETWSAGLVGNVVSEKQ